MFLSRFFGRRDGGSIRRSPRRHRPLVESLDGRQLLSTLTPIVGNHIGLAAVQGGHIGSNAAIEGNPIGLVPSIQGAHIG